MPPSEVAAIATAISEILDAAKRLSLLMTKKKRQVKLAARAVLLAATETRQYITNIEGGGASDREKEGYLANLWMEAHWALIPVDCDLADRCLIKATCWSDPRLWSDPKYEHVSVDLSAIMESYSRLSRGLAPKRQRRLAKQDEPTTGRDADLGHAPRRGKALFLPIKKEFFERIVTGRKNTEYRRVTPYWTSRIERKDFAEVIFRNGYSKDAPTARVECTGVSKRTFRGERHYAINLGQVLEVLNYDDH